MVGHLRISILFILLGWTAAQFPPKPRGVTTIQSKRKPGASLSYKETQICETTKGVKGYSGYVNLPSTNLGSVNYNVSTFFWYFEARQNPQDAPLAMYLAGGPGQSSMFAATGEGGPCYVNRDSETTTLNPWSWNTRINVLYIDNPAQTGFSYDTIIPSQDPSRTANSSVQVAHHLWKFAQIWLNAFPKYQTSNRKISIWTHSWGGFYGPSIGKYFSQQNENIEKSHQDEKCASDTPIRLDTLGLVQGCIDTLIGAPYYPQYAYNNTYDLRVISEEVYKDTRSNVATCQDQIQQCRVLANQLDPQFTGSNDVVNINCTLALVYCFENVVTFNFANSDRSGYDISQTLPDVYPFGYQAGYFNQRSVQEALGVPVNFTAYSNAAATAIEFTTGDGARANITNLDYVLQSGIKVAMIYGDRDYRCNWLAGENISLSVDYPGSRTFWSSGYEKIITNDTYIGGVVRQYGGFSFSRVFEAGHYVHAAQPETFYRIFNRVLSDTDVATGTKSTQGYSSKGPASSFGIKNVLPPSEPHECNTWQMDYSCTQNQVDALTDGTAIVEDYMVVSPAS